MPGLKKKYIKLADGDFKKAWKLQKKAGKKVKKKVVKKKVVKKKVVKKKVVKKKVVKKKVVKKKTIKKIVKKIRKVATVAKKKKQVTKRRRSVPRGGKIQRALIGGGAAAAGAIGAGVAANFIPIPNPKIKAAIPILMGIVLAATKIGRGQVMQTVSAGMIAAGALAVTKQLAPNVPLLAGEDDEMVFIPSNEEEAMLGYTEPNMLGEPEYVGDEIDDIIDSEMMGEAYDQMQGEAFPGEY